MRVFTLSIMEITTLSSFTHLFLFFFFFLGSDEMTTTKIIGFMYFDKVCLNIYVNGLGLVVVVVGFLVLMFLDTETSLFN